MKLVIDHELVTQIGVSNVVPQVVKQGLICSWCQRFGAHYSVQEVVSIRQITYFYAPVSIISVWP